MSDIHQNEVRQEEEWLFKRLSKRKNKVKVETAWKRWYANLKFFWPSVVWFHASHRLLSHFFTISSWNLYVVVTRVPSAKSCWMHFMAYKTTTWHKLFLRQIVFKTNSVKVIAQMNALLMCWTHFDLFGYLNNFLKLIK